MRLRSLSSGVSLRPQVRVLERLRREDEVVVLVRVMEGVIDVRDVRVADSGIGVEVPVVGCEGIGVLF
jgi:hypothetical protein